MDNKDEYPEIRETQVMNWFMANENSQKQMDAIMNNVKAFIAEYPDGRIGYFWRGRTYYVALRKEPGVVGQLFAYETEYADPAKRVKHQVENGWMQRISCGIECSAQQNPYLGELLYKDIISENQK